MAHAPAARGGGGLVYASARLDGWRRWATVAVAVLVVVLGVDLPYGIAFKLVTVLGVLSLPVCAYAFGRLAELPFPGPPLLAVASVLFLFDRNFTIYGGNIASTLAGEFAFSISLSLPLLYLGVVIQGLRTGQHRALAAVLLALTGLCHLIPAFFAIAGTRSSRCSGGRSDAPAIWLACVFPVAGLLSAFWVLPFWWQRDYVNDMGWEKLPYANAENGFRSLSGTLFTLDGETYWKYLIPRDRRRDAQRHALGPRAGLRRRRALDRVPHPRRPLPHRLHAAHGHRLRGGARGPALERAPAALLLPRPLPARGHRCRRDLPHPSRCCSPEIPIARASSVPRSRPERPR